MINFGKQLGEHIKKDSVYSLLSHKDLFEEIIKKMIKPFENKRITKGVAPEMKGLFYGPIIAYELHLPFIAILKKERISRGDSSISYKDYSKKRKGLGIEKKAIKKGDKILLVDDIFETGEIGKAIIKLIEKKGARVKGISIVYNKLNKKNEDFFKKYNLHYLIKK
jgi:adenine phosphoribosyltransferase